MDQSITTDKNIDLYCLKFCKQCEPYIHELEEQAKIFGYGYKLHYIENDPINSYQALIKARNTGAFIQHAPFMILTYGEGDKYKAIGGILKKQHIIKLLKRYEQE